jgi:hypothetical protein
MKSPVAIVVAYRAELWTNAASIQLIPLWFILPLADSRVGASPHMQTNELRNAVVH